MAMIKQFSGPRMALLWQYGRGFFWFALLGAPVTAFFGVLDARPFDALSPPAYLFAIITIPLLVVMEVSSEWGFRAFHRRLPVATSTVVNTETVVVFGLMLWLLFNYAIAYHLASPLSKFPTPWSVPFVTALGLIGTILPRSFEAVKTESIVIGLGAAAVGAGLAATIFYWPLSALFGPAAGDYARLAAALVFLLGAGYTMALHCTHIVRHGGLPLKDDIVQRIQSLLAPGDQKGRVEVRIPARLLGVPPLPMNDTSASRKAPIDAGEILIPLSSKPAPFVDTGSFASPVGAQAWYELRDFRDPLRRLYRFMMIIYCLQFSLIIGRYIPGDPGVLSFACSLSLLLWFHILVSPPDPFSLRMPLSDWTRARVYLRLSWPVLAILEPTLWLLAWWMIGDNPHPAYSSLTGVLLLLGATLWVGWISLALGPIIFFTAGLATIYDHWFGEPPATLLGVLLTLACLYPVTSSRSRIANSKFCPDATACFASSALLLGGFLFMSYYPLPPVLRWTIREGLGALLILPLLRHHAATGLIPADASRRLMRWLIGGSATLWIGVMVLGPPREPDQGIAAIYLTFGMVPPCFLPFLMMPRYVAWTRVREEQRKEFRSLMPWLK